MALIAVLILPLLHGTVSGSDAVVSQGSNSPTANVQQQFQVSIQTPSQNFLNPSFFLLHRNSRYFGATSQAMHANASVWSNVDMSSREYQHAYLDATADTREDDSTGVISSLGDGMNIDVMGEVHEWPIHNELFEGKMVFLLRSNPTNEYDFGGDQNIHYELQLQGRFKRSPGPLYLSIEVPAEEKFRISWPMRAAANAICSLIKFFGYHLHNSFGEKGDLPHFASPAYQAFDKFIHCKPNQTSPKLGQYISEPHDSCMKRRKFEAHHTFDTSRIYTMSFNDTFFDPVKWHVTGVPLFKRIDISKFAKKIRLVVYEVHEEDNKLKLVQNGDARALARGIHTKRNVVMWLQLQKRHTEKQVGKACFAQN